MEGENESLAPEEKAYFESRGTSEVKPEAAGPEKLTTEVETEAVEPVEVETEAPETPDTSPQQPQKQVPLAALTKERAERKAEKAELAEQRRLNALWQERWNTALQPPQEAQAEPEMPSPEDPMGRINWLVDQISQGQKQSKEQAAQNEQHQQFQRVLNQVNNDLQTASKDDATVTDAHQALRQSLGNELMAMGYNEQQAVAEIRRLENQHAVYVAQNGLKIGDHIKAMASARGWVPKTAAVEKKDPAAEVAELAEKVEASTSLQNAGGGAPQTLDANAIANMSPDDFEKWLSKPGNQQKFKRLAGG